MTALLVGPSAVRTRNEGGGYGDDQLRELWNMVAETLMGSETDPAGPQETGLGHLTDWLGCTGLLRL